MSDTPIYDQITGEWEMIAAQLAQIAIYLNDQKEQLDRIEKAVTLHAVHTGAGLPKKEETAEPTVREKKP